MLIGCFDLESTSNNPEKDRIVEFAAILWDTTQDRELLGFERRINPGVPIAAGALAVHGISDADVMKCQGFEAIAGGVVQLIGKMDLLVGHNIKKFDLVMLAAELKRVGSPPLSRMPPVFDTMLEGRGCTDDGKIPSLGELCFALDVGYDSSEAHAALYDVRVNLAAFLRGIELGAFCVPGFSRLQVAA